jgi:hypothetical protein
VNELGVPAGVDPLLTAIEALPSSAVATGVAGVAGGSCMETIAPAVVLTAAMLSRVTPPMVVKIPPRYTVLPDTAIVET